MSLISTEIFIEKLGVDVYPVTLLKYLLNRGKISFYFSKAADSNFEMRQDYNIDYKNCELCKTKSNMLCRKHTSIDRILNANNVLFDSDINAYIVKNEIFKLMGDKLVVIYCPHTKLITGNLTDEKVRKIRPMTFQEEGFKLPKIETIKQMASSDLMNKNMKCWFNNEFSIITIPNTNEKCDFVLTLNI